MGHGMLEAGFSGCHVGQLCVLLLTDAKKYNKAHFHSCFLSCTDQVHRVLPILLILLWVTELWSTATKREKAQLGRARPAVALAVGSFCILWTTSAPFWLLTWARLSIWSEKHGGRCPKNDRVMTSGIHLWGKAQHIGNSTYFVPTDGAPNYDGRPYGRSRVAHRELFMMKSYPKHWTLWPPPKNSADFPRERNKTR